MSLPVPEIGAEHLLVVAKPVAALLRQEESGHGLDRQLAMALLENRADVDHRVDVRPRRRVSHDGRLIGDSARNAQSARSLDDGAAGSSAPAKANSRQRPSALTMWPRCTGLASARRITGAE